MISSTSRYSDSTLITSVTDSGISVQSITPSSQQSYTFTYVYHTFNGSDRMDSLSYAFYGDPTLWWKIGDANPEILDWSSVTPGTLIRIPNA